MKKILLIIILILISIIPSFAWQKKGKPIIILTDSISNLSNLESKKYFKTDTKIYFTISNPKGFKSDYIKYQIVKQEDNAHVIGYTRIRNITCRIKNKYNYTDYFVLSQKGKYFIQVFDITNLQQWLAIEDFTVVEE